MCKSYTYRGFIINRNNDKNFNNSYLTIVNPKKHFSNGQMAHCHLSVHKDKLAKIIIDCYYDLKYCNYSRSDKGIRSMAMRLDGLMIHRL